VGGAITDLADIAHVGAVAGEGEAHLIKRILANIGEVVASRRRMKEGSGAGTRAVRQAESSSPPGYGEVFLIVDGWANLHRYDQDLEDQVVDLASRGLNLGVHVVATARRWSEIPRTLADLIATPLELKLDDPLESRVDRRSAELVPPGQPGRGLTPDGHHFLVALPPGAADVQAQVSAQWPGASAPRIRVLPDYLTLDQISGSPLTSGSGIPLGVDEGEQPASLHFEADPHFVVLGDGKSGKTNILRVLALGLSRRYDIRDAAIIVVDYRYGLLDLGEIPHVLALVHTAQDAAEKLDEVIRGLRQRLPLPGLSAAQLRARDWWRGPDVFVLIDDYQLVARGNNPALPLVDLLPQARNIGLHVLVARHISGAGHSSREPLLRDLRDVTSPAFVLSGNFKEEGEVFGVRPQSMAPGRGLLAHRHGVRLVQSAYQEVHAAARTDASPNLASSSAAEGSDDAPSAPEG
jgi:S-DNA-T family DNA segregation ATPase FtsK/SpoIIIE